MAMYSKTAIGYPVSLIELTLLSAIVVLVTGAGLAHWRSVQAHQSAKAVLASHMQAPDDKKSGVAPQGAGSAGASAGVSPGGSFGGPFEHIIRALDGH